MLKLAVLDAKTLGSDISLTSFEKYGDVSIYSVTSPGDVADRIKNLDMIITNKVVLNESNLKDAAQLKLICLTATGTNNVDLEYARSRNIAVTNVAGYSTQSVTQHTFAMLFYLLEQLKYYDDYCQSGEYAQNDVFDHLDRPFWELDGKTWGIIGLGAIGKSVAAIARSFGCRVVYYSTSGRNDFPEYSRLSLDDLLKTSDVVSIHAPLNPQTRNLLDYQQITKMKKHGILLNLGRGTIVNEKDLAQALDEGLIGGAGLDVLEKEPIQAENPLLTIRNKKRLLITPHIAWASKEARERVISEVGLNIEAYLRGENRNRV